MRGSIVSRHRSCTDRHPASYQLSIAYLWPYLRFLSSICAAGPLMTAGQALDLRQRRAIKSLVIYSAMRVYAVLAVGGAVETAYS